MYRSSLCANYADRVRHQYGYGIDLLQIDGGYGAVLPDILGVCRVSETGLSSHGNIRSRRVLDAILMDYFHREPWFRGRTSSNFLLLAIVDIKNRRTYMKRSVRNFFTCFSPLSFFYLFWYGRERYLIRAWMKD